MEKYTISSKRERLEMLIKYYSKGKNSAFAELIGVPAQNISAWLRRDTYDIEAIYTHCRGISPAWLITGEGNMLVGNDIPHDPNYINNSQTSSADYYDVATVDNPPIVPTILSRKPGIDILDVVRHSTDGMEICPVHVDGATISWWHRVDDDSLLPDYRINDKIALRAYPKTFCRPIPGMLYGVDTYPYGLIFRKLFPCEDGYMARAINREDFPDMMLPHADIIRFYRIVVQVRMH